MAARRRRVVWSQQAAAALDAAVGYIAQESPPAARGLLEDSLAAAGSLDTLSERGAIAPETNDPGVRQLLIQRHRLLYGSGTLKYRSSHFCTSDRTSLRGAARRPRPAQANPAFAAGGRDTKGRDSSCGRRRGRPQLKRRSLGAIQQAAQKETQVHTITLVRWTGRVAALLSLLSACTQTSSSADRDVIRSTRERALSAFNAGELDQFMAVWPAEDIVVMVPGTPPIVGKQALRTFLEQAFAGASIQETLHAEEQVISGDWAFERLAVSETVVPRNGATPIRYEGKGIDIYHRQRDGSWKAARSILNYKHQ